MRHSSPTETCQVRFALSSAAVFSRSDTTTDSARFYTSLLEFFDEEHCSKEMDDLLQWWNQ